MTIIYFCEVDNLIYSSEGSLSVNIVAWCGMSGRQKRYKTLTTVVQLDLTGTFMFQLDVNEKSGLVHICIINFLRFDHGAV